MNKQFIEAMYESGVGTDLDLLFYVIGLHCWCGQRTQNLSKYNKYDYAMGH